MDDIRQKIPSLDPGFLERNEFRGHLPLSFSFPSSLLTSLTSSEFYRFVFQFSREGTHKTIGAPSLPLPSPHDLFLSALEKEIICGLMPIVLDRNRAPHLEHFLQVTVTSLFTIVPHHPAPPPLFFQFLEVTSQSVITLDQWESFLQFNESVDVNLSQYNDDAACTHPPPSSSSSLHSLLTAHRAPASGRVCGVEKSGSRQEVSEVSHAGE
jgi:hypothetical protein